jgi:hypothetical protein
VYPENGGKTTVIKRQKCPTKHIMSINQIYMTADKKNATKFSQNFKMLVKLK